MPKKEKHYLIDFTEERAVGYTYSRENAHRLVVMNPKWTSRDFVKDGEVLSKLPYLGKVATIKVLQYLFSEEQGSPEGFTMTELQMYAAGATETSVITALSDMKNKRYVGDNQIFVKKVNGRYVRQEPSS